MGGQLWKAESLRGRDLAEGGGEVCCVCCQAGGLKLPLCANWVPLGRHLAYVEWQEAE